MALIAAGFFRLQKLQNLFLCLSSFFLVTFVSVCLRTIAPETVKGARASSAFAHRRTGWSLAGNGKHTCNDLQRVGLSNLSLVGTC